MDSVRPPAVAGTFYPGDAGKLRSTVDGLLAAAPSVAVDIEPRIFIVPHAGYVYSGPVAATAYKLLGALVPPPSRIVAMGPSHFVPVGEPATSGATEFATPLGRVTVDADPAGTAPGAQAHAREHSLEVQLPFLQVVLDEFSWLPILTGERPEPSRDVLDQALTEPDVVAVISSDLSHYLDYETARRRDAASAEAIVALRPEDLAWEDACGRVAVQAALLVAQERGWTCHLLDLRNSGDTAGPKGRVVGYGAFAIGPTAS